MSEWRNTTHDWTGSVDLDHLARIRRNPGEFAPGVGHTVVTVHPDGSISVADDGRGTDTRADGHGDFVKKPVMSTKDLRFFDSPEAQRLSDGRPRRSVPVTDLSPIPDDGTTGTTVRFLPGEEIGPVRLPEVGEWPYLSVEVVR
ncbi:ATP-binding protein [Amycolatopsis sp. WAC 04197]|uniref:ATP-binding protein n=1 Tax=Amycolatopsis sp. WAC 04197 TaxID=2203199 RepID=UPI001F2721E7|nr:ATP-binding protein [Amycolatopsis sp. WAC 04197]